jgi:hypothetical protein
MEFRRPVDSREIERHRCSHRARVSAENCTIDVCVSEPCKPLLLKARENNKIIETPRLTVKELRTPTELAADKCLEVRPQITLLCDAIKRRSIVLSRFSNTFRNGAMPWSSPGRRLRARSCLRTQAHPRKLAQLLRRQLPLLALRRELTEHPM